MKFFDQLKLLVWKNFALRKRQHVSNFSSFTHRLLTFCPSDSRWFNFHTENFCFKFILFEAAASKKVDWYLWRTGRLYWPGSCFARNLAGFANKIVLSFAVSFTPLVSTSKVKITWLSYFSISMYLCNPNLSFEGRVLVKEAISVVRAMDVFHDVYE